MPKDCSLCQHKKYEKKENHKRKTANRKKKTANHKKKTKICNKSIIQCNHTEGSAFRSVTSQSDWYTVNAPPFPQTTLLSMGRNKGRVSMNQTSCFLNSNVTLTDTGLTVNPPGLYWVSISVILFNNESSSSAIPIFLGINGQFDPNNSSLGSIVVLSPNGIGSASDSCTMELSPHTELSILASSPGASSLSFRVVSWKICVFKIPCDREKITM